MFEYNDSELTNFNCEPFLINWMSSPNLILEIIQKDNSWKGDGTSIYLINFSKIIKIEK
jgi:hypothetical protein